MIVNRFLKNKQKNKKKLPASTQVINPEAFSRYCDFMVSFTFAVLINFDILFAAWFMSCHRRIIPYFSFLLLIVLDIDLFPLGNSVIIVIEINKHGAFVQNGKIYVIVLEQ